jgi:small subunit ribosomal protein S12
MSTFIQAAYKKRRSKLRINRVPALDRCPFKKGVILKLRIMKPKKPNSANRKVAKLRLSSGKKVLARIPGMGYFLQEHGVVLIHGKRVRDLPGMHYSLVKGVYDFSYKEIGIRRQARSRYGYRNSKKKKRMWLKKTKGRKKRKNKMMVKSKSKKKKTIK